MCSVSTWLGPPKDFLRSTDSRVLNSFRFYYADERTLEGAPVLGDIDAEAHADFYKQLVDGQDSSIPWLATFAAGRGYVNFPRIWTFIGRSEKMSRLRLKYLCFAQDSCTVGRISPRMNFTWKWGTENAVHYIYRPIFLNRNHLVHALNPVSRKPSLSREGIYTSNVNEQTL